MSPDASSPAESVPPTTPVTPEVDASAHVVPEEAPVAPQEGEGLAPAAEDVAQPEAQTTIGMPPNYQPKPVEAPGVVSVDESAQAIARDRMIQNQAMMARMTPPMPGTPAEMVMPTTAESSSPVAASEQPAPSPASVEAAALQPTPFTPEAAVEAAERVSEPPVVEAPQTPEAPQQ